MQIKCEYCGQFLDEAMERCPSCGAPNNAVKRNADSIPKTIEELKAFCQSKNMPLEQMRFFIGVDYREPKAFGIYKDDNTGEFIVYKNKANGERAVRYHGRDEAYAVNEIYQKLKQETAEQKNRGMLTKTQASQQNRLAGAGKKKKKLSTGNIIVLCVIVYFVISTVITSIRSLIPRPSDGYYSYGGNYYYYDNNWYIYDTLYDDWYETNPASELIQNFADYYESYYYDDSYDAADITESDVYQEIIEENLRQEENRWSSDDWDDDDWDNDWGGWDSDSTDWDSDW